MMHSLKTRVFAGFGAVLLIMVISSCVSMALLGRADRGFTTFRSALDRRDQAVAIDLTMQKVRVRVNQWLRSGNANFVSQADELLLEAGTLAQGATSRARTDKERRYAAAIANALSAYVVSWHVIQDLYANEAALYRDRLIGAAPVTLKALADIAKDGAVPPVTRASAEEARYAFQNALIAALQYRAGMRQQDADRLTDDIGASLGALDRMAAQPAAHDTAMLARISDARTAIDSFAHAFTEIVAVATTRAARLVSWTNNEGEAMAVGASALRAEGQDAATESEHEVVSVMASNRESLVLLSFLILVSGVGISLMIAVSITRPLGRMADALKTLASGNHTTDMPDTHRRDEIGAMARAAQILKDNATEMDELRAFQETGRLDTAARQKAAMHRTADGFQARVGGLVAILSSAAAKMQDLAKTMSSTASHTNRQAGSVAEAAEQTNSGVQMVAAAAEQLSASIAEITRQVADSPA